MLALLIVVSWVLAAFGEEVAYRGYVLTDSPMCSAPGGAPA